LIWNSVNRRSRQVMRVAGNLLVGGLALAGIPATWDYVHFMNREGSPVLGISFMWVFLPFVLLLVALVVRSAWAIWGAFRGVGLEAELRL
jgi:TRAP-type C4-dicarboxylate transport system permease small subunit